MDFSWTSPHTEAQNASIGKIMDRHRSQDMGSLLVRSKWHNDTGDLAGSEDEVVCSMVDEGEEFYKKAYEAFKQGQDMPHRLRRSVHALQDTPSEMKKAGIELRPAQLEGAGLLCWLEKKHGLAILADDMGVGKTFQLLALIFSNRPDGPEKTTLLVVPAGAITMWKSNLDRFQDIKYVEYNNRDSLQVEQLSENDIVLTTYTLVSHMYYAYAARELDIKAAINGQASRKIQISRTTQVSQKVDIQRPWAPLFGMVFHRVVLDEAHRIRNVKSAGFKAMSRFQTQNRIACSGTIFNNDYTDVGAILTFLRYQPWCNPSSFKRYFLKNYKKQPGRPAKRAQLKNLRGAVFKYTLDGISIRRNKRDKFEGKQIINVEKLDFQKREHDLDDEDFYLRYEMRTHTELETQKATEDLWLKRRDSEDEDDIVLKHRLPEINFARLCCISQLCPNAGYSNRGLTSESDLDVEFDFYGNQSDIQPVQDNASAFVRARENLRKMARNEWNKSTKLCEAVRRICGHLEQNAGIAANSKPHKILVYCEFLSGLDVLEVGLEVTCPQHLILRIDGQSSTKSRNDAIRDFMQSPKHCIILVTVNAGSEAIDLSAADYVLFLHPIWNPAQLQQCIGRAYRHGQEKRVKARILVARHSIETYVYSTQDQKRKKDLLLKTPIDTKTMEQVEAIRDESEFVQKVLYSAEAILYSIG